MRRLFPFLLLLLVVSSPILSGCTVSDAASTAASVPLAPLKSKVWAESLRVGPEDARLQPLLLPRRANLSLSQTVAVDGGYVACGLSYNTGPGTAATLVHYDLTGKVLWEYRRPLEQGDSYYHYAVGRSDGSVAAVGLCSDRESPEQGLVSVIDKEGKLLWERRVDYPDRVNLGITAERCLATADGGLVTLASTTLHKVILGRGYKPLIAVKYDTDGNLLWQREYDYQGSVSPQACATSADGSLYASVIVYPDDYESRRPQDLLLKLDSEGSLVWQKQVQKEKYAFAVKSISFDKAGNLVLACKANYLGEVPEPNLTSSQFHDAYRGWSYHPAAIIKLNPEGELLWEHYINGLFGASGLSVFTDSELIYAQVTLVDDAVPPPLHYSIGVLPLNRECVLVLDQAGTQLAAVDLPTKGLERSMLLRVNDGVLIAAGFPKHDNSAGAWPERPPLPAQGVLLSASGPSPEGYGLALDDAKQLICKYLAKKAGKDSEQMMSMVTVAEITESMYSAWEMERLQLFRVTGGWVDGVAVAAGGEVQGVLLGMPITKVFLADLNNDWRYEVCANFAVGSGIVSQEVAVIDTASGETHHLGRRAEEDLYLEWDRDGLHLQVKRIQYGSGKELGSGQLVLTEAGLEIR